MALWALHSGSVKPVIRSSRLVLAKESASLLAYCQRTAQKRPYASSIVYADRGVVVANKPSGLVCQLNHQGKSSDLEPSGVLRDFLVDIKDILGLQSLPIPVHRLDKPTTGTLLFALNAQLARDLSQQLHSRAISKTYLAVVRAGSQTFPHKSGTIHNKLSIGADGRVNIASSSESIGGGGFNSMKIKSAETGWEVLAASNAVPLSLVKLNLHTGIKHQLRAHMARVLSAPILGDNIFASPRLPPSITNVANVPVGHMYLHASQLSLFRYTPEGKRQRVTVMAPLPGFFTRLCAQIGVPLSKDYVKGGVWIDGERIGNAGHTVGYDRSALQNFG